MQVTFVVDEGPKVKVCTGRSSSTRQGERPVAFKTEDLQSAMKSKTPGFPTAERSSPRSSDQDATQLRLFMRSRGYKDADVDSIRPVHSEDGKGVSPPRLRARGSALPLRNDSPGREHGRSDARCLDRVTDGSSRTLRTARRRSTRRSRGPTRSTRSKGFLYLCDRSEVHRA